MVGYNPTMPSKDPQKIKAAQDRYRERHAEKIRERRRRAYHADPEKARARQAQYKRENPETVNASNKKWRDSFWPALRAECITAYGGRCACCGEKEPMFLDVDHIHNDGKKWRKAHQNSRCEMLALKRAGWPTEHHQLLCCNCNQGKARNGGICPHLKNRS